MVTPACSRRSPARPLRDARARTVVFAYLFAVYAYVQPVGYRHTYPTDASRRAFAESFAGNPGLRLLYGQPHQIDTTAGYTAWRVGGVLAIAAAAYGLLAAVRAGRAEEESGRMEVVLAAPVSRATANTAGLLAIAAGIALLWARRVRRLGRSEHPGRRRSVFRAGYRHDRCGFHRDRGAR